MGPGVPSSHGSVGEDFPLHRQATAMVQPIHCSTARDVAGTSGSIPMQPGSGFRNISAGDAQYGARAECSQQFCGHTPSGTTTVAMQQLCIGGSYAALSPAIAHDSMATFSPFAAPAAHYCGSVPLATGFGWCPTQMAPPITPQQMYMGGCAGWMPHAFLPSPGGSWHGLLPIVPIDASPQAQPMFHSPHYASSNGWHAPAVMPPVTPQMHAGERLELAPPEASSPADDQCPDWLPVQESSVSIQPHPCCSLDASSMYGLPIDSAEPEEYDGTMDELLADYSHGLVSISELSSAHIAHLVAFGFSIEEISSPEVEELRRLLQEPELDRPEDLSPRDDQTLEESLLADLTQVGGGDRDFYSDDAAYLFAQSRVHGFDALTWSQGGLCGCTLPAAIVDALREAVRLKLLDGQPQQPATSVCSGPDTALISGGDGEPEWLAEAGGAVGVQTQPSQQAPSPMPPPQRPRQGSSRRRRIYQQRRRQSDEGRQLRRARRTQYQLRRRRQQPRLAPPYRPHHAPQGVRLPQPASVQQPSRRFCRRRTTTRHRQAASCHSDGARCGGHGDWCTRMPTYVHPQEAMSRFAVATAVHGIRMSMPMPLHEPRPLH